MIVLDSLLQKKLASTCHSETSPQTGRGNPHLKSKKVAVSGSFSFRTGGLPRRFAPRNDNKDGAINWNLKNWYSLPSAIWMRNDYYRTVHELPAGAPRR